MLLVQQIVAVMTQTRRVTQMVKTASNSVRSIQIVPGDEINDVEKIGLCFGGENVVSHGC